MTEVHNFSMFYKENLLNIAKQWDERLLSGNFENIADVKKVAGIREGLMSMYNSMDSYVKAYLDRKEEAILD